MCSCRSCDDEVARIANVGAPPFHFHKENHNFYISLSLIFFTSQTHKNHAFESINYWKGRGTDEERENSQKRGRTRRERDLVSLSSSHHPPSTTTTHRQHIRPRRPPSSRTQPLASSIDAGDRKILSTITSADLLWTAWSLFLSLSSI